MSVFRGDFRTSICALNSVFKAIKAVSSRNSNNRLIILPNKAYGVIIDNLCYYRISYQLTIVVKIALKVLRDAYYLFLSGSYVVDSHGQKALRKQYIKKEIIKINIELKLF